MNACRHGLAGAGDLLAPDDDARQVARRASAFARELAAPGEIGHLLAHRAAVLSVRMERLAERDLAVNTANAAAAVEAFDQDRATAVQGWIEALDQGTDVSPALLGLASLPEGLTYLVGAWSELRAAIAVGDVAASSRAALWLGVPLDATPDLAAQIDAELARLRALEASSVEWAAGLAAERAQAALIARFDPSPAGILARRYEAAAERGLYRALRAIADLRRAQEAETLPIDRTARTTAPPPPASAPSSSSSSRSTPPSLGSFGAQVLADASPVSKWIVSEVMPDLIPPEARPKRPDLRKLDRNRR